MNASSNVLIHHLQALIKEKGAISFATFMEQALYHPTLGYYNSPEFSIGKRGDFTTAPEISPLFAACLAHQIKEIFSMTQTNYLFELGAGTGRLAQDLLLELKQLNCLPEKYIIYEPNIGLRSKQQIALRMLNPDLLNRITWVQNLPTDFEGIVIANEVLDALPIHIFRVEENDCVERCVTCKENEFAWVSHPLPKFFHEYATQLKEKFELSNTYQSEINFHLSAFLEPLSNMLKKGLVLFFDYGYGQAEYYHPERRQGTLTCFYKHQRHNNPFLHIGKQDITAHVDFTHVIETAVENNFELAGFTTQAAFLIACGIADLATEKTQHLNSKEAFNQQQAIKTLTLPTEMGDRIKVMALSKNIEPPSLIGFSLQDRRRDL